MDETISPSNMSHFQVVKQVGKGAYGTVYKVIRKSDSKVYAIKVINIGRMDEKTIKSNLNEIRILSSISHPNVVGYKEAFLEKKNTEMCIVMEYVGGGDLAAKISDCKKRKMHLNEESIWKFFIQTLLGLKAFHDMKIIHRDIKSANLFLAEDYETIKVGDLNVAKVTKNDLAKTQIGTPYYLAPEIWKNEIYTYKCDVFSLGVVLYEMAALKVPFEASSIAELCRKVTNGTFGKISSRYSEDLYEVISLMLTKDPRKRPSVDQLLAHPFIAAKMMAYNLQQFRNKEAIGRLMGTIVVPKNLNHLNQVLPKEKKYRPVARSAENLPRIDRKRSLSRGSSRQKEENPSVVSKKSMPGTPKKPSRVELPEPRRFDRLPPPKPKLIPPIKAVQTPSVADVNKVTVKKPPPKPRVIDFQHYAARVAEARNLGRRRANSADKAPIRNFFF